jgi:hypothetical protein
MINILFMHKGDGLIRGSERCLLMLLERLDREAFHPVVICNHLSLEQEIKKLNIKTYQLDFPEIMIDGHYKKLEILAYVKAVKKVLGIANRHTFDLIYSNSGLPCQVGFSVSKVLKIPIIVHLHAPHTLRYAWLWLFRFADRILFVSRFIKDDLSKKIKFEDRSKVIYNGVDCQNIFFPVDERDPTLRQSLKLAPNDVVIGQVGSLIKRKGLDILIKAFKILSKKHDNAKLLVIGDGELRERLEAEVKNLSIDGRVRFLGEINPINIYYQNVIDINVLASRSEAFPLSLLEASACGLPNVCTNCEGMIEAVVDGVTGLLFEKENHVELADKLSMLIASPELRSQMGRSGREKTVREFNVEGYAQHIQQEILDLINTRPQKHI